MKTTIKTLMGAGLALLVAFAAPHGAAAPKPKDPPPAQEPPILFVAPVNNIGQIFSMNVDGSGLKPLTRGSANAYSPSRSPDYRYIAFVRSGMLTVMEAKGEPSARVFTVCPSWSGPGLDWSPDGSSIVFCGSSELDPRGLWEVPVNPDTKEVGTPALLREGGCFGPSWSPDGTKIAFHLDGVVRVLDLGTGTEISFGCWASNYPTWNATGDKIAFAGVVSYDNSETGYYEICIANPDLTGVTPVTSLKSFSRFQSWSPDGTRLVFQSNVSGSNSLHMTEIDSGSVTMFCPGAILPNWAP